MAPGDEYFSNLLKIEMTYTGERNTAANIFYAECEGAHGATLTALSDLADNIGTHWGTYIMPYVTSAVELSECRVSDWTSADGLTGIQAIGQVGSLTGEPLPAQVATLLNYATTMRYRGGRGRLYIPQPTGAQLTNDTTWSNTFIGDVNGAILTMFEYVNDQTIGTDVLEWCLYHRAGSKVVAQGTEPVVGISCSPTPGTQRRRVRRVGHRA